MDPGWSPAGPLGPGGPQVGPGSAGPCVGGPRVGAGGALVGPKVGWAPSGSVVPRDFGVALGAVLLCRRLFKLCDNV